MRVFGWSILGLLLLGLLACGGDDDFTYVTHTKTATDTLRDTLVVVDTVVITDTLLPCAVTDTLAIVSSPDAVTDTLRASISGFDGLVQYDVLTLQGQIIRTVILPSDQLLVVYVGDLPEGVYVLFAETSCGRIGRSFTKLN